MSTGSHLHGWGPRLAARYFDMNLNNAYKIYCLIFCLQNDTSYTGCNAIERLHT
jgi:hypothetical protein